VRTHYGSDLPATVTGEYRFGDTRHIFSDTEALQGLGWRAQKTPVESVAAYAEWLKSQADLDQVLQHADATMRSLGVVRGSTS
jgi:dTDP-L-rhamnose 4-epimerase